MRMNGIELSGAERAAKARSCRRENPAAESTETMTEIGRTRCLYRPIPAVSKDPPGCPGGSFLSIPEDGKKPLYRSKMILRVWIELAKLRRTK